MSCVKVGAKRHDNYCKKTQTNKIYNEIKSILQYIFKYDRKSSFYHFKANIRLIRLWWLGQKVSN